MNAGKRPPKPEDVAPRRVADGAGKALDKAMPTNGSGLGPVGEELIQRSLEVEKEGEPEKHLALFTSDWRKLITRGNRDPQVVAALNALIDKQMRRFARAAALKSSWGYAAAGGTAAYVGVQYVSAAAHWLADHVPILRAVLKLFLEGAK